MNESQLVQTIKAHIAKGDKAKDKADQHYIAAGQHLKTLKAQHGGTWAEWEALLKEKIGIGKSRASELMQIADGTKTLEGVRADTAERTAKTRALQSSPLRSGENAGEPEASVEEDGKARKQPAKKARPEPADMPTEAEAGADHQEALYDQARLLPARMTWQTRERFCAYLRENYHEFLGLDTEDDVIDLVEEVLDGQPLSDKQAATFEKIKKRLRRGAQGYAKREAQNKKILDEHMAEVFPPLVEKLVAGGLARELWAAIVQRTECGMPVGGRMSFIVGDRLVETIEEAVGVEALAAGDRACSAPVENAPPPDVGAANMKARMAALDDGLDVPEILRREPKAAAT